MPEQEAGVRGGAAVKLQAEVMRDVWERVYLRQVQPVQFRVRQPGADRRLQQQLPHGGLVGRCEHVVRAELQEADFNEAGLGGKGAFNQ